MPRILVVDDDDDVRTLLEHILSAASYEVDVAATVKAAQALLACNYYNLLVIGLCGAVVFGSGFAPRALSADATGKCGYYVNSNGNQVPRPCGDWRADSAPPSGATARCRDGSWSWSQHRYAPGTCSHHGGVRSYR